MVRMRAFAVIAISIFLFGAASAEARVPLEAFAARPAMASPRISPNGAHVAVISRQGEAEKVLIYDVASPQSTLVGYDIPKDVEVDWIDWANDSRLLIGFSKPTTERFRGVTYDTSQSRVIALNRDGSNYKVLFQTARKLRQNFDLSGILSRLPNEPESVLMAADDGDGRYSVYRVNVVDGKVQIVLRGNVNTRQWLADTKGVPRIRWDFRPRRDLVEIWARKGDSEDFDKIAEYGTREFPEMQIVGFTSDDNVAIAVTRNGGDRFGFFEYNIATRAVGKPLYQHPSVDVGEPVGGPIYDPQTGELAGVFYVDDVVRTRYFDATIGAIQSSLDATFSDAGVVRPTSWSRDRKSFIVSTSGPKDPGSHYFYDPAKNHASLIGRAAPNIPAGELGEMLVINYKSRDGTKLPGYLTLPPGKGDKKLPLVVMPHGGPEVRDFVSYDAWAQVLANRGYAVFQPNFRGSGGYGRAFAEAGHRQWGRRMQDDVTDGVKALIADGTADANRVCIVGASYGGYAALAGGAFTPDLYKCVIAIAGVSDIPAMLDEEATRFGVESAVYSYWVKRLGDPKVDLAQMQSVSPALQAASFRVPVLLVHGEDDSVVPIDQSNRMEKALTAAGKTVKYVKVEDEGHNFSKPRSRLILFREMETFLGAHIGN